MLRIIKEDLKERKSRAHVVSSLFANLVKLLTVRCVLGGASKNACEEMKINKAMSYVYTMF